MPEDAEILTVTQLTREIRELLEGHIGSVWVEGEVSNLRVQSSGHQYFTLKDATAQISCVFFRGAVSRNSTRLQDGMRVLVHGEISVYEPRGQYQMVVKQVQARGKGSLQEQFEALKRRLHAEGLFDEERKQAIPQFPNVVSLVTSPTGAAVRDMLNILSRRAPWVRVLVFPVRVQGQGAEHEIVRALEILANAEDFDLPTPDTIVIARGGGSLEDLWCFNEEVLARAVAACPLPVISAVGHEIDFTIADFVADLRAPTPSAAAELIAPDTSELRRHFTAVARTLHTRVGTLLAHHQQVVDLTAQGVLFHTPARRLQQAEQEVDEMETRLCEMARLQIQERADEVTQRQHLLNASHPKVMLTALEHQVDMMSQRLGQGMLHRLDRLRDRLDSRSEVLKHIDPHFILARGFSLTTDMHGHVISSDADVKTGQEIITQLAKGKLHSVVK